MKIDYLNAPSYQKANWLKYKHTDKGIQVLYKATPAVLNRS